MTEISLTIVSDPICPWCYIGRHRLSLAIERIKKDTKVKIVWNPFELNPQIPKEGMLRNDYLRIKFGSVRSAQKIYANVSRAAEIDSLSINFEGISKTPNTRDAHKLIQYALDRGTQDKLVTALFSAYFKKGQDIGNFNTLVKLAETADIDRTDAENAILDPELNTQVELLESKAIDMGIMGVPSFLFNGRYLFSGAQSSETIRLSILNAIAKNLP